jgi:hypothetical protein
VGTVGRPGRGLLGMVETAVRDWGKHAEPDTEPGTGLTSASAVEAEELRRGGP